MLTKLTLFMWLIILFGAALRVYIFTHNQLDFYWDEVAMLVDVRSILESGTDMHGTAWYQTIFPSYGDFKLPLYIWVASAIGSIVGFSLNLIRLPNLLVGILMIPLVALFAKTLVSTEENAKKHNSHFAQLAGIWTAITIASAPWAVHFSVTGFESHLGQFLITVGLFILISKKIRWSLPIAALFGVLGVYSYYAYRYIFLALLVLGTFYKLWTTSVSGLDQKKSSRKTKTGILIDLAIGGILAVTLFTTGLQPLLKSPWYSSFEQVRLSADSNLSIEPFVHQANELRMNAGNTISDRFLFHPQMLRGISIYSNVLSHLDLQYLFSSGDSNPRHGPPAFGLFPLFLLPLLIIGLYSGYKRAPKALLFLLGWWLLSVIPASIPLESPHALRSLGALAPLTILFGIGGAESTVWLQSFNKKQFFKKFFNQLPSHTSSLLALIFVVGVLTAHGGQLAQYYTTYYRYDAGKAWQAGYSELALAALELQDNDVPIFLVPSDDRFYLWLLLHSSKPVSKHTPLLTENFRTSSLPNISIVNEMTDSPDAYWLATTIEMKPDILSDQLIAAKVIADSCEIERFTLYKIQK